MSNDLINSYCKSLDETFAELAYHGILTSNDAHCFSAKTLVEGGSYILVIGAVLLGFLTKFVTKAMVQSLKHTNTKESVVRNESQVKSAEDVETEEISDSRTITQPEIRPVEGVFSETFRLALRRVNEDHKYWSYEVPERDMNAMTPRTFI